MSFLDSSDFEIIQDILGTDGDDDFYIPPQGMPNRFDSKSLPSSLNTSCRHDPLKCSQIVLGGTSLTPGITTDGSNLHSCTNLFCMSCDHPVIRFENMQWNSNTDYLFLRLNYPETVQSRLHRALGYCAYCCQCTSCSEKDIRTLSPFSTNWVCRGHT